MKTLTQDQINAVVDWMNNWGQLKDTVIPLRFKEDWTKQLISSEIKLDPVYGSTYCRYSVIENKLEILYKNQEKLLQAIKLLGNGI